MTVAELIEKLKEAPQDAIVYVEGELADKVITEGYDKNGKPKKDFAQIVRIFKAWNLEFTGRNIN